MFTPKFRYAWQNPVLRDTIYPFRDQKLRDFLLAYQEIDWWAEVQHGDGFPEIEAKIRSTWPQLNAERSQAQIDLTASQAALDMLEEQLDKFDRQPVIRDLIIKLKTLQFKAKPLEIRKRLLEGYIRWSEKIAPNDPLRPRKQDQLQEVADQLAPVQAEIDASNQAYNMAIEPLAKEEQRLEDKVAGLQDRISALDEKLASLPKFDPNKTIPPATLVNWKLADYRNELEKVDHDQLMARVLDRFEADRERFPKWLQYMVIHFSGMRYKSAHGSWCDPKWLLSSLRLNEIETRLKASSEDQVAKACQQLVEVLKTAQANAASDPDQIRRLQEQIDGLRAWDKAYAQIFANQPDLEKQWEDLRSLEKKHEALTALFKQAGTQDNSLITQSIADLENQTWDAKKTLGFDRMNQIRKQLAIAAYVRRRNLGKLRADQAAQEISQASDYQVLGWLQAMQSQIPAWAWVEIVARTRLRLDTDDPGWEELSPALRSEKYKFDRENSRWRDILYQWQTKDITAWRAKHASDLSLVVTRAVCNEISEHIQHLRSRTPYGGLTAKPPWYLKEKAADPQHAFLKVPAQRGDFPDGASILFLGWVVSKPHAWSIARPVSGLTFLTPGGEPIANNLTEGSFKWTYHINSGEISRDALPDKLIPKPVEIPPAKLKSKQKKVAKEAKAAAKAAVKRAIRKAKNFQGARTTEWLRWTHEAIVIEVADMADGPTVLTFETGEIGVNLRSLRRLSNHWDVFVGYVPPGQPPRPELDSFLIRDELLPD